ncbi:MAG: 5'/3'-nucleotidase SurE [Acidimicrobiales bacterium]
MRILVTNDDGVHAPGLAGLVTALARWADQAPPGEQRQVVVVAPLANHSGASAAVGTVYERTAISYRAVELPGAGDVPVYGLDASPALSVIVGCLGAFGPRPDLVMSGINLGVNVGRSVLHSGTVGAALTGAQLGLRGLAVSLRSGSSPEQWGTASTLAVATLPELSAAPAGTVLNLNVPSVPLGELRGVRRARISGSGIVRSAGNARLAGGGPAGGGDPDEGEVRLALGAAVPSLGRLEGLDPDDDASLVAAGYASLTPLVGVREDTGAAAGDLVEHALEAMGRALDA